MDEEFGSSYITIEDDDGNEIELSATAWDFADAVAAVDFHAGTSLVATATSAPYAAAFLATEPGTLALCAVARSAAGGVSARGCANKKTGTRSAASEKQVRHGE